MNQKAAAIGEHSSVIIFHTAGIKTVSVNSTAQAQKELVKLIKDGYGIIFLSERYAEEMQDLLTTYRTSAYPLILPIPDRNGATGYGMKKVFSNMEKALGTNIFENQ